MTNEPETTNQQFMHIATSKNGIPVVYDPVLSHAASHLEDTPELEGLVKEVISNLELHGQEVGAHFDLGRIIGRCDVVKVGDNDEIVYGIRKNRMDDGLVPFTKSRQGDPCRYVALHLLPAEDGKYILSSAWIGTFGDDDEPFPMSKNANERSRECWERYAFVYGSQEIIEGTETRTKPW